MGNTSTFNVINNRLQFRCPVCKARRNMALPTNLRRKNITCHKCSEITNCILNRRVKQREPQAGKITMVTADNKEIEVTLHNISPDSAGFELPPGNPRALRLSLGSKIRFKCAWNPKLLGSSYYEVKTIVGQRVGVKRT